MRSRLRRLTLGAIAALIALLAGQAPAGAQTVSQQVDAAHTGVAPGPAVGPPLEQRWRRVFDASVPISHTVRHALAADGRVFVTAQPSGGAATVFALDPADGHTLWSRELPGWMRGAGYGSGRLLVSTDSTLYALSAADGSIAWSRSTWPGRDGSSPQGGAVVAAGTAYIGVLGYGAGLYALDVGSGSVRWWKDMAWASGIAVAGDRVVVNDVTSVVALKAADGGELWRHTPASSYGASPPSVRGGRVFVPHTPDGPVLDAATGQLLRRTWMGGRIAVDEERSYVLASEPYEDGDVLAVSGSADGARRWELGGIEGITSYPVVSGETVYAMGVRGVLYAADRRTGALTWCGPTGLINYSETPESIAVGEGLVLLAVGGELLAMEPGGTPGCDFYGTGIPGYREGGSGAAAASTARADAATASAARTAAAPPGFEPNHGQLPASVRFAARGAGHALLVGRDGATLALGRPDALGGGGVRVGLRVRGARPARLSASGGGAVLNDYRGASPQRWRTGIRLYDRVRARRILPGIDLVLRRGAADHFEYDFVVAPRADPRAIALEFTGARRPRLGRDGTLLLDTPAGVLRQPAPVAYQRRGARRERVPARFAVARDGSVRFVLGRHDRRRTLVIDPVLEWSSFLGGGFDDQAAAVATDPAGHVYVAGTTRSRDFPIASPVDGYDERNAICAERNCTDAFVAKYAPGGSRLVHVTYLSGFRNDSAQAVAADVAGNAYVTGFTMSPTFPTRAAFQPEWRCGAEYGDAFVAKLAPDGSALAYSTYLGGCGTFGDAGRAIAVDGAGRAVIAGQTDAYDFPTTAGAADRICAPPPPNTFCDDGFVARLSADGSKLEYSTLFGGDDSLEVITDLELDAQGRPVVAGYVNGFGSDDFPGTPGAYEPADKTGFDEVFGARLAADGSQVQWASAFGGVDHDDASGLALDAAGDVHLTGTTESDDFPTTAGALDRVCNVVYEQYSCTNHPDAFALELSADGSQLLTSTYVGGGGYERGGDVAVDGAGRAHLVGTSSSSAATFAMVDAFQPADRSQGEWCASRADCSDVFVATLDAAKARVVGSSFLGGRSHDTGAAVALHGDDAWIAGTTWSTDLPTTAGVPQRTAPGGNCGFYRRSLEFRPCMDAFVARVGPGKPAAPTPTPTPAPTVTPAPAVTPAPGTGSGTDASPGGTGTAQTGAGEEPGATTMPPTAAPARIARRIGASWRSGVVRGRLRGASACVGRAPVRVERRGVRGWRTLARGRTRAGGLFTLRARWRPGRHRVRAPELRRTTAAGAAVICRAATHAVG